MQHFVDETLLYDVGFVFLNGSLISSGTHFAPNTSTLSISCHGHVYNHCLTSIPLIFFSLASGFCDLEDTTINVNNGSEIYTWNETPAGTNQSQECIHGGGMAIRLCRFASVWEEPDLSSCISRITSVIQVIVDVSCSPDLHSSDYCNHA